MNQHSNANEHVSVTLAAHQDESQQLLMARITAAELEQPQTVPAQVALVIDRSGSMQGRKLEITKQACGRLVRLLSPQDRVAVVIYDHEVDVLAGLQAPSERLAAALERIQSRGNTNLYKGWVTGAKLVGAGGRVILLSDGLANTGRYTDAVNLAHHAGISYRQYQVSTTTIGVGEDYDEALMAGMARSGGGSHYFAHSAEAIMNAFDQEQFSIDSAVLQDVRFICNGEVIELGHLWGKETKTLVIPIRELKGRPAELTYTVRATGQSERLSMPLPSEFGKSDEVTLEYLLYQAAECESAMVEIRNAQRAQEAYQNVRDLILKLLNHPLADQEHVQAAIQSLDRALVRLERLRRDYDEREATMHRKRSLQSSHNLRERAKAFSSFEEEEEVVVQYSRVASSSASQDEPLVAAPEALALAPLDKWREWRAVPVEVTPAGVRVVLENPKAGFARREMEIALRAPVRIEMRYPDPGEIETALDALEKGRN